MCLAPCSSSTIGCRADGVSTKETGATSRGLQQGMGFKGKRRQTGASSRGLQQGMGFRGKRRQTGASSRGMQQGMEEGRQMERDGRGRFPCVGTWGVGEGDGRSLPQEPKERGYGGPW